MSHYQTIALLLTALFPLCSCSSQDDIINVDRPKLSNQSEFIGIERGENDLTNDDAAIIGKIFRNNSKKSDISRASTTEVIPLKGPDGEVDMYAVNFTNGYILVSATRKSVPIQAIVHDGHFNEKNLNIGEQIVIGDLLAEKTFAKQLPHDKDILLEWERYVKPDSISKTLLSRASSIEMTNARGDIAGQLRNQGYDTYYLKDALEQDILPSSVLQKFLDTAEEEDFWADTDDNAINAGVIAVRYSSSEVVNPKCKTQWYQGTPFQASNKIKQGCTTIAIGQIMRFHEWPSSINWSAFPNSSETHPGFPELKTFLAKLRDEIGVKDDGNATIQDVINALNNYGYTSSLTKSLTYPNYLSYKDYPICTFGIAPSSGKGHAWVIDGVKRITSMTEYLLFLPDHRRYPQFVYTEAKRIETTPTINYEYYHMNYGLNEYPGDGWYLNYELSAENDPERVQKYTSDRSYLYIKKK